MSVVDSYFVFIWRQYYVDYKMDKNVVTSFLWKLATLQNKLNSSILILHWLPEFFLFNLNLLKLGQFAC